MIKNLGVWVSIGIFTIGLIAGWGRLQAKSEETIKKVEIIEKKVSELEKDNDKKIKDLEKEGGEAIEKIKEENQETEKIITEFKVEQKYIQQSLTDLTQSVKELIKEIKEEPKKKGKDK